MGLFQARRSRAFNAPCRDAFRIGTSDLASRYLFNLRVLGFNLIRMQEDC